jgi:hypothetical protein
MFEDGDPPSLVAPSKFKRGYILERFHTPLRKTFGGEVKITVADK